jgi:esterase/lipase
MQAALEKYLQDNAYQHLTFIGYSGGGVIAMLLAKRFPQTNRLVTIAANLDIDAWTRYHNFSALSGSINPATQPPLPWSIQQTHYAGKRDKNVPVAIINYVSSRQPNSKMRTKENFDHICCWEKEWPDLLKELNILPK